MSQDSDDKKTPVHKQTWFIVVMCVVAAIVAALLFVAIRRFRRNRVSPLVPRNPAGQPVIQRPLSDSFARQDIGTLYAQSQTQ